MWVYWLTLGALASVLYFPYKKIFNQPVALRASLGTFVLGLAYPLLQANLSVAQTFICLGLLLLFLGVTAAGRHPAWDKQKNAAGADQAGRTDTTELSADGPSESQPAEHEATDQTAAKKAVLSEWDVKEPVTVTSETTPAQMQPEQTTVAWPEEQQWQIMADREEHTVEVVAAETFTCEETDCLTETDTGEKDEATDASRAVNGAIEEEINFVAQAAAGQTETADPPAPDVTQESLPGLQEDFASALDHSRPPDVGQPVPHQLLAEGLRLARHKKYAQAVRCLNQVIAGGAEPELLYLAVSQLSSIYQHLGLYPMAWEIINVFAEHPSLKDHPGQANLLQKAKFIRCLMDLLNRDRYGHIPYEQVPETVRREAFDNSLNIKYLIS
ncbi:hypothetical protein [Desulforamulus hydrothermalis]|uniref:Uncharacterized protein n=1 Tax=Desulforamulus hydrothermalis Lam5 = DSM 18033 TaxID=1121428 RepID=K8E7F2_9FIRM|nr:hypothetical protein [Desulforamulus hydrothermalis]CCO07423.1 conserved hypothetical protein [Desulforamulus hydrothermalis Lam5 = DSM 18033]SHH35983.1 hypothetical protein SAMN02745177_02297 [Desulforamulus hydrothermalis Lam5 = DSM 18033]